MTSNEQLNSSDAVYYLPEPEKYLIFNHLGMCHSTDVHNANIQEIGLISGIPHFCGVVGSIGGAIFADYLRNRKILSVTDVSLFSCKINSLYYTFKRKR